MTGPLVREDGALERELARLEAENARLRDLVAVLRRESAEGRDVIRQEVRRCSHP